MQSHIIDSKELFRKFPILQKINLGFCVDCKAVKLSCGLSKCPLVSALDLQPKIENKIETISNNTVFGPSPQIFVGSYGYPSIYSGPLTSLFPDSELAKKAANPSKWTGLRMDEIIELRFGLLRGKQKSFIRPRDNSVGIHDKLQELSLSTKPVEIEGLYSKKPDFSLKLNSITQPIGPSGFLTKFDLTSNPKIPNKVDQIIKDDLKAHEQMNLLYNNGYDIYYLQNIFSSGATGLQSSSKLVPTRWSITATDDMIGKELIVKLRDYPTINNIEVLQGNFMGNYYNICFIPGNWSFENLETWFPGSIFTLKSETFNLLYDAEGFDVKEIYRGRTSYAKAAGGYYATRLGILEYLHKIHRQAKIVSIREILPEYTIPVGVWAVREGVKLALQSNSIKFETFSELFQWLSQTVNVDYREYVNRSLTFSQRSLTDFFEV